jgi:hypothetical protein
MLENSISGTRQETTMRFPLITALTRTGGADHTGGDTVSLRPIGANSYQAQPVNLLNHNFQRIMRVYYFRSLIPILIGVPRRPERPGMSENIRSF